MTTLMEKMIKIEPTTPERKIDDSKKSSSEILSELFGVFNADPPKINETSSRKKKSKKKHKKKDKKRSRSTSSDSESDDSEYSHKRKKRKKSKSKKRRRNSRTPSISGSLTPVSIKPDPECTKVKQEEKISHKQIHIELKREEGDTKPNIKVEDENDVTTPPKTPEAIQIPMPESPKEPVLKQEDKKQEPISDSDKAKAKIQIKNLKFSAVFEETVKKAEEEARKRAEKYEEGEYTDSSNSSVKEVVDNSQFPKTSDPGGILKQNVEDIKLPSNEDKSVSNKPKKSESSNKSSSSRRHHTKSHKRSKSKSYRSRSRSPSRRHRRRSRSRSRHRSRSRRRSRSRTRHRPERHYSPRHRARRSRSPSGVKLADSEKKRLLEVARRNAINMLKNGAVPAGAAVLPPHTRNQVMAAIQSGGKSVDELTDFCKHLSKKEALGELSSVSSNDGNISENEDTIAFHHPFLVKEKAPIMMNIRGGAPLPVKSTALQVINKEELRIQFPVSSGTQHREKVTSEWRPVSPKKDMQIAKINSPKTNKSDSSHNEDTIKALPAPPSTTSSHTKSITSGSKLSSVAPLPALPAPGPQSYPPGVDPVKMDMATLVSQKLSLIRKEQEENELSSNTSAFGFGWTKNNTSLGQFTGSTGAQILTPKELASGTQAWAKKLRVSSFEMMVFPGLWSDLIMLMYYVF